MQTLLSRPVLLLVISAPSAPGWRNCIHMAIAIVKWIAAITVCSDPLMPPEKRPGMRHAAQGDHT